MPRGGAVARQECCDGRHVAKAAISELSRWGRSTIDLLETLRELQYWKISVITIDSMAFDSSYRHGGMLATVLPEIAEFKRDLISQRFKSGLASENARGKKLGRLIGNRPKLDRLEPKVMELISDRRCYRWISRDLGISENTVDEDRLAVLTRHRQEPNRAEYPWGGMSEMQSSHHRLRTP
ncbi:recombinase family protein [Rhizobium skierniewicense]|nr:recombinase family protein [Rhizobium skierniewicense]